jgi:hypothetical protein
VFSVIIRLCPQRLALREPQYLFSLLEETGGENLAKNLIPGLNALKPKMHIVISRNLDVTHRRQASSKETGC